MNDDSLPVSASSEPPSFQDDQGTFDRWQILDRIGEGGMSVVYKARHRVMNRMAAVKILHKHLSYDANNMQRFQQEARAAGAIEHQNIIGVFDCGMTGDDQPFLVMEYVKGNSLSEIVKANGAIAPKRAIALFSQICDGLACAHLQGIIHRDLKPSNVMVVTSSSGDELVKIVDFGIAKLVPQGDEDAKNRHQLTHTGDIFGSPLYMSPEQCTGQKLDLRSDVYSMGCLMYECLSGEPPFLGSSYLETMYKHLNEPPASLKPAKGQPSLQMSLLNQIVGKALSKDPQDRYQSMSALKADLQAAKGGWTSWLRQAQAMRDLPKRWQKANKKQIFMSRLFAGVFTAALLVSSTAGYIWLRNNSLNEACNKVAVTTAYKPSIQVEKSDYEQQLQDDGLLTATSERALALHEVDAESYYAQALSRRARTHFNNGHLEEAIADAQKCLHYAPSDSMDLALIKARSEAGAHLTESLYLKDFGNPEACRTSLKTAAALGVKDAGILMGPMISLGDCAAKNKDWMQAAELYKDVSHMLYPYTARTTSAHFQDWVEASLKAANACCLSVMNVDTDDFLPKFLQSKASREADRHARKALRKQFRESVPGGGAYESSRTLYNHLIDRCGTGSEQQDRLNLARAYHGYALLSAKFGITQAGTKGTDLEPAESLFDKALRYAKLVRSDAGKDMTMLIERDYADLLQATDFWRALKMRMEAASLQASGKFHS